MAALSTVSSKRTIVDVKPALQAYFQSLESRIGYRLVLGGTRHHGYWKKDTWWMLPVSKALRRMEGKMFQHFSLSAGSQVLDAGCGVYHVALYMASPKLHVTGIDIVDHHLEKAGQGPDYSTEFTPWRH